MLQISFNDLMKHYPRKRDVDRETLFRQLGWDDLINNPAYENTCAIRVSVALIRSSVTIPGGRIPIKTDPHKGKKVEPGQAKLSAILTLPSTPPGLAPSTAHAKLAFEMHCCIYRNQTMHRGKI